MIRQLSESVLQAGLDDWVPMAAVEGFARKLGAEGDLDVIEMGLRAVRGLAGDGLVVLGDVSDGGFFEWIEPLEDALDRLERTWRKLDPGERGFACWLRNTDLGNERARTATDRPR